MDFRDGYPTDIEFPIDRELLRRYWRRQAFLGCCLASVPLMIMVATGMTSTFLFFLKDFALWEQIWRIAVTIVVVLLSGGAMGTLMYFVVSHYTADRATANLRLLVEGPYLRIVSGAWWVCDRRIHFREVGDYCLFDGPMLRWYGLKMLRFRRRDARPPEWIEIVGLVDVERVRDQLCDIDAAREGAESPFAPRK